MVKRIGSISKDLRSLQNVGVQKAAALRSIQKDPGLIFFSEIGCPEWENLILMHIPCILYSLLSRPTNAQHIYTGLFEMIVGVLTTCHTLYTWDRSIFLFNSTTLQIVVAYLTGALYVHPLWFYKHQHDNRVRSKLFVACQRWWFQWRFWFPAPFPPTRQRIFNPLNAELNPICHLLALIFALIFATLAR